MRTPPRDISLDAVVDRINDLTARHSVALAHDIGAFVLRTFFGDDPATYFAPSTEQRVSLRKLASHPRLKIAASTLSVYIRFECHRRALPPQLASALTLTQHRHLMRLEDIAERIALGTEAWEKEWTERQLAAAVRARLPKGQRQGNKPAATLLIKRMEKTFDDDLLAGLLNGTRPTPAAEEIEPLLNRLEAIQTAVDRVRTALEEAVETEEGRDQPVPAPSPASPQVFALRAP